MEEILASINASIEQLDLEYVQHQGNNIPTPIIRFKQTKEIPIWTLVDSTFNDYIDIGNPDSSNTWVQFLSRKELCM